MGIASLDMQKGTIVFTLMVNSTITIKRTHVNKMIARRLIRGYDLKVED